MRCEIHEHMQARILVVDSPYYAVSGSGGQFQLQGIPPGDYTLHAVWDKKTRWTANVTVRAGRTVTVQPQRSRKTR